MNSQDSIITIKRSRRSDKVSPLNMDHRRQLREIWVLDCTNRSGDGSGPGIHPTTLSSINVWTHSLRDSAPLKKPSADSPFSDWADTLSPLSSSKDRATWAQNGPRFCRNFPISEYKTYNCPDNQRVVWNMFNHTEGREIPLWYAMNGAMTFVWPIQHNNLSAMHVVGHNDSFKMAASTAHRMHYRQILQWV